MPPLSPHADTPPLATTPPTRDAEVYERLHLLERQLTLAAQRQRDHVDAELQSMREQVLTLARETRQQHQSLLTGMQEAIDELRQEVAEALQHLSQDVERVGQHAEAQTTRVVERVRHDLLETLLQRTPRQDPRQVLGELLVRLGKQLQDTERGASA